MDRIEQVLSEAKDELKKKMKDWKVAAPASAVLLSSFYVLQMISQRAFGRVGLHSGVSAVFLAPIGCCATVANLYGSQVIEERLRLFSNDYTFQNQGAWTSLFKSSESDRAKQRRLALSIGAYILLERGLFKTSFPSSVISIGSFGNVFNKHRFSIPAVLDLTTEAQRAKIQTLGKRFGCHQCGSRQLRLQGFIADHMPPSRFAKDAAAICWRRWFKIKVDQRLWPQCQSCYSLQGSAVRAGTHKIVYHRVLKPFHFSSALGYLALQHPEVAKRMEAVVDPCIDACQDLLRLVQLMFKQ